MIDLWKRQLVVVVAAEAVVVVVVVTIPILLRLFPLSLLVSQAWCPSSNCLCFVSFFLYLLPIDQRFSNFFQVGTNLSVRMFYGTTYYCPL
jgi:hypothetical protein